MLTDNSPRAVCNGHIIEANPEETMRAFSEVIEWMPWPECQKIIESHITYLVHIRSKGCEGLPTYVEKAYWHRKCQTWQRHYDGECLDNDTIKFVAEMPKELPPDE